MRFHEISVCVFMLFDPKEISLREFMLLLHTFLVRIRLFGSLRRMFAFIGLFGYFDRISSAFLSCAFDCECNRPSVVATVFDLAEAFNGDLNKWDVAKVTKMDRSKSIRVVESDLRGRELML